MEYQPFGLPRNQYRNLHQDQVGHVEPQLLGDHREGCWIELLCRVAIATDDQLEAIGQSKMLE